MDANEILWEGHVTSVDSSFAAVMLSKPGEPWTRMHACVPLLHFILPHPEFSIQRKDRVEAFANPKNSHLVMVVKEPLPVS